jgi:hypothetical protein
MENKPVLHLFCECNRVIKVPVILTKKPIYCIKCKSDITELHSLTVQDIKDLINRIGITTPIGEIWREADIYQFNQKYLDMINKEIILSKSVKGVENLAANLKYHSTERIVTTMFGYYIALVQSYTYARENNKSISEISKKSIIYLTLLYVKHFIDFWDRHIDTAIREISHRSNLDVIEYIYKFIDADTETIMNIISDLNELEDIRSKSSSYLSYKLLDELARMTKMLEKKLGTSSISEIIAFQSMIFEIRFEYEFDIDKILFIKKKIVENISIISKYMTTAEISNLAILFKIPVIIYDIDSFKLKDDSEYIKFLDSIRDLAHHNNILLLDVLGIPSNLDVVATTEEKLKTEYHIILDRIIVNNEEIFFKILAIMSKNAFYIELSKVIYSYNLIELTEYLNFIFKEKKIKS